MTTQFVQQVPFTFLLRLAPDNSYFILCPREVSISANKCMNFFGYGSFADYNSVMPHYMPPTPVDFSQFGASWCNESLTAYFNAVGLSSYKKEFHYEGVMYQNNGNNLSAQGINNALLVGRLEINNQIDTDFDNLFTNLISSLNTLLTPVAQISLSLLGINNLFPTLVHNLQVLNENNVPVSIAEILRDKQIDVDMSQAEISLDDTNLVTQLQNIYTILSSQNSNQAAISSAITNKDNQSNIVDELRFIFTQNVNSNTFRSISGVNNFSTFKSWNSGIELSSPANLSRVTLYNIFRNISNKLSSVNDSYSNNQSTEVQNKFLYTLSKTTRALFSDENSIQNVSIPDIVQSSFFKAISEKLQNIETKLEQNLPFTVVVDNEIVETNVSQNCNYSSKIEQIPFSE